MKCSPLRPPKKAAPEAMFKTVELTSGPALDLAACKDAHGEYLAVTQDYFAIIIPLENIPAVIDALRDLT